MIVLTVDGSHSAQLQPFNKLTEDAQNSGSALLKHRLFLKKWIPMRANVVWVGLGLRTSSSPSEIQFPVESTPRHVWSGHVLERFVRNHIDDWTHDSRPAGNKQKSG